jgi:PAS domain S-box-containing protein
MWLVEVPSFYKRRDNLDRQGDTKAIADRDTVYEILRHVPVAIYHIDLIRKRFLMVNEYMCQEIGYSEEELLKLDPSEVLAPRSRALFIQRLTSMAAGVSVSSNVDLQLVKKNGACEWGRLYIHHVREGGRITSAYVVGHKITEHFKAHEELANHRQELERLVDERTSELAKANERLRDEIEQRAAATEKLKAYSQRLEEMNTAMRVLLDKRNEDHKRAEELIRLHLKELIDPYLERLENSELRNYQKQLVDVIRTNVDEVMGAAAPAVSSKFFMFSPNELQVVNLIRTGKTTKEMARLLNLSPRTIEAYRNSIRKKLNLKHKKINLRTYLSSL